MCEKAGFTVATSLAPLFVSLENPDFDRPFSLGICKTISKAWPAKSKTIPSARQNHIFHKDFKKISFSSSDCKAIS